MTLRWTISTCSLGAVLLVAGDHGVRAIALADEIAWLHNELHAMFPSVALVEDAVGLESVVSDLRASIDEGTSFDHPLDIVGTEFQRQVWQALSTIPFGSTITYTELAARIGSAHAVRAVAGACAANMFAVVIPCHRVVRADGGIADYRWGRHRKRTLLERESSALTLF